MDAIKAKIPWLKSRPLYRYEEIAAKDEKSNALEGEQLYEVPMQNAMAAAAGRTAPRRRESVFILLHLCLVVINLVIMAVTIRSVRAASGGRPLIHSPALDAIDWRRQIYMGEERESYYIQPPSLEIDQRWHDLVLGNFIRVSQEDLAKVGRLDDDPVLLEDGSGVGLLNAHHEIHCIMGLYHASHPEYYWPNATEEQRANNRHHVDHCLDYLLQASMCHGDVGFMTYHWKMDHPIPYWKSAQHTCVNWDRLKDWMAKRKAPINDPGYIVHPRFGPPYPNGVQNIPTINDLN